ncbi:hypothetical protein ACFL9U_04850 [Thermodesulfobacteriota bacterium]
MRCQIKFIFLCFLTLAIFLLVEDGYANAGNIDPDNNGSQYAYGKNIGWFNFEPSNDPGVTVSDSAVTGYAWAENIGWINMNPSEGGVFSDGIGNLKGYAWAENAGWISFSCQNTESCESISYGVRINPENGVITGNAWGENIGWVSFNSTETNLYGAKTSWVDNVLSGDINDNGKIELGDAIMGLQICAKLIPLLIVHRMADVNGDSQIGIEEVNYVLQNISELR